MNKLSYLKSLQFPGSKYVTKLQDVCIKFDFYGDEEL
jgi:hypothetical protein